MEKYSRYRDPGSGIAPFFPIPTNPSGVYLPLHILLFAVRIPLLLSLGLAYFLILQWLPIGALARKACLWVLLAVPGIWWVDLQIDGVKRGNLHKSTANLPRPGSIIVASSTSPLDALYLAAVFDPLFTQSYPNSRLLRPISLMSAIFSPLLPSPLEPPSPQSGQSVTDLPTLIAAHKDRILTLFPEATATNGRAILPLTPALATAPPDTPIFAASLRYTPADVTTPVPGWRGTWRFLWCLCGRGWTHTVRVRISEQMRNTEVQSAGLASGASVRTGAGNGFARTGAQAPNSYSTNFFDQFEAISSGPASSSSSPKTAPAEPASEVGGGHGAADLAGAPLEPAEAKFLDRVAETLARLGRVRRVALGPREKKEFVALWRRRGKG